LGNTVVLDRNGVMNPGGLRFGDEFVRHKVLDLMGDLALLGAPVVGRVRVDRGGHALHYGLVLEVLAQSSSWTMVGESARGVKQVTAPNSGVPSL
jgi:UDP-3-O-[3-hydroxymyristoyl] N-acetylglucosamine deacetylase